jgi:hypothetical protein
MITSKDISNIILEEIKPGFDISNVHGIDLRKYLMTPVLQDYINSANKAQVFRLWTVFEETGDANRYVIFYDEKDNSFGLGMKSNKSELFYLANYGSFLKALESM